MNSDYTTSGDLITELIKEVKNQKRPEKIEAPIYGLYSCEEKTFIYSDSRNCYNVEQIIPSIKEVRSVKAFALSIKEELRRRNNQTGDKATVNINLKGGTFIPDDNFGNYQINFNRLNSQQWNLIKTFINRTINQGEFLLLLAGLKPSIEEQAVYDLTETEETCTKYFQNLFGQFACLRTIGHSELTSNPIMIDSKQEKSYKCTYRLKSGEEGEEKIPAGFKLRMPFAKAGDFKYTIPIDLIFARDEDNGIMITILCPTFENIEEKAIIEESNYIKEQTNNYSDLLILSDF